MKGTMGRSRRPHLKSRNGYGQCKRRRTKCSEQRPSCANCTKRGLVCSFADGESSIVIIPAFARNQSTKNKERNISTLSRLTDDTSVVSHVGRSKVTLFRAAPPNTAGAPVTRSLVPGVVPEARSISCGEIEYLRLMHNYSLSTSRKLAASPEALTLWHDLIPSLAFEYDFLLHGILAVSALEQALSDISTMNHSSAIAIFRQNLTDITPENIAALFVFSIFAVFYVFGSPLTSPGGFSTPLSNLHNIFALTRGCRAIVHSGKKWLEPGPYMLLLLPHLNNPFQELPKDIEETLALISKKNFQQYEGEAALLDAFTETICILRHTFLLGLDGSLKGQQSVAVPFIITMPELVAEKVREEESLALVMLAHYGVILHWSRKVVSIKDWGKILVNAIQKRLDDNWMPCIAWAMNEVRRDDARDISGL